MENTPTTREAYFALKFSKPKTLFNLPRKAHQKIMKHLGPVCSTTLGLTCKKLYVWHRQIHGTVGLDESYGDVFAFEDVEFGGQKASFFTLGEMLDMWARPDLKYELPVGTEDWPTKFVPKARFSYKHCAYYRYHGSLFTGKVVLSIPAGWEPT